MLWLLRQLVVSVPDQQVDKGSMSTEGCNFRVYDEPILQWCAAPTLPNPLRDLQPELMITTNEPKDKGRLDNNSKQKKQRETTTASKCTLSARAVPKPLEAVKVKCRRKTEMPMTSIDHKHLDERVLQPCLGSYCGSSNPKTMATSFSRS